MKFCSFLKQKQKQNYEYVPYERSSKHSKKQSVSLKDSYQDTEFINADDFDNSHMISSTLIQVSCSDDSRSVKNAYSNEDYASPDVSFTTFFNSTESIGACSCCSSSSVSNKSSLSTKKNQDEDIYVCSGDYRAKIKGDINLKYADRVRILYLNEEFALVENLTNGNCGYVLKSCIKTLTEFINDIKLSKSNY